MRHAPHCACRQDAEIEGDLLGAIVPRRLSDDQTCAMHSYLQLTGSAVQIRVVNRERFRSHVAATGQDNGSPLRRKSADRSDLLSSLALSDHG